jgi:hypothetical protein
MEIIAVYSEDDTEPINTCGQDSGFFNVRAGGIYSKYSALMGYIELHKCYQRKLSEEKLVYDTKYLVGYHYGL